MVHYSTSTFIPKFKGRNNSKNLPLCTKRYSIPLGFRATMNGKKSLRKQNFLSYQGIRNLNIFT